ncbi:unnamed protein product, partial [Adineta steineri]
MEADDDDKCRQYGITWESTTVGTHYTMTIGYPKNTSQQYAAHFNIYVWLSDSLVANSIGICTQFDPECLPTTTTSTTTVTTSTTTSTTTVTTSSSTTNVQGPQGPIYECSAITDPHVYTWRLKGSAQGPNQYQDCY